MEGIGIIDTFKKLSLILYKLTTGSIFMKPSRYMSITLDVEMQNCIFRKVTAHLRLHQMGSRIRKAEQHWSRQQAQLTITKIGRCGVCDCVDWG